MHRPSHRASVVVAAAVLAASLAGCASGAVGSSRKPALHSFAKQQLTDEFWSEGACFADINRDGVTDVVSGPFWYEGPTFATRHEYAPADKVSKSTKNGQPVTFRGYTKDNEGRINITRNETPYTQDLA